MLDFQFELLSTKLNDETVKVERHGVHSASAFLAAPYGTYPAPVLVIRESTAPPTGG